MISNTNKHFKWTKQSCNNYTVENLTEDDGTVKITSETNTYNKEIILHPGGSASIKIPSDGVYKICLDGKEPDNYTTLDFVDNLFIKRTYTIFTLNPQDVSFDLLYFDGSVIYDANTHGAATTSAFTNLETRLDAVVGAGYWELVAPSVASTLAPFSGTSTSWRIVLSSLLDKRGDLVVFTIPPGTQRCFVNPDIYCQIEYTEEPTYQYVTVLNYDGVNQLEDPTPPFQVRYDFNKVPTSEQELLDAHIVEFIELKGGTVVESGDNIFTYTTCDNECLPFTNLRHENMSVTEGCDIVWCDFLYELCALHACVTAKVKEVLCLDCEPCKECDNNFDRSTEKKRQDLLQLATLFFYGLIPLVTEDRMKYLGDMHIDQGRITKVMEIKDLYKKLVNFADRCGECIEEIDPCGCGCTNC